MAVIDIERAKSDAHLLDAWNMAGEALKAQDLDKLMGQAKRIRTILGAREAATEVVLKVSDIFAPMPPVPWIVEDLGLSPGAPALIAGKGYTAKTLAAQAMLIAIATGTKIWGRFPCVRGPVLHLDYEQGDYLTRWRYQRLARAERLELDEEDLHLVCMPRLQLDQPGAEERLNELCADRRECLIDSFRAACTSTDENSSEARAPFDMLHRVSQKTGCHFTVIHHGRKGQQGQAEDDPTSSIRGSTSIYDACASVFVFRGGKGKPTIVHHEKQRVTGQTCEDFVLEREDVPKDDDTDRRWGLRLNTSSAETARLEQREKETRELSDKIIDFIKKNPGCSTRRVRVAVGGRTETCGAAIDTLEETARIKNHGGKKKAQWSIT